MVALVLQLILIGVLLWGLNRFLAPIIDGHILRIINVVVIVCVVLYVLAAFGLFRGVRDVPVPQIFGR